MPTNSNRPRSQSPKSVRWADEDPLAAKLQGSNANKELQELRKKVAELEKQKGGPQENGKEEPPASTASLDRLRASREELLLWDLPTGEVDARIQKAEEQLEKDKQEEEAPTLKVVEGQLTAAENVYKNSLVHLSKVQKQFEEAVKKAAENKKAVELLQAKKEEVLLAQGGFGKLPLLPTPPGLSEQQKVLWQASQEATNNMFEAFKADRLKANRELFELFAGQNAAEAANKEADKGKEPAVVQTTAATGQDSGEEKQEGAPAPPLEGTQLEDQKMVDAEAAAKQAEINKQKEAARKDELEKEADANGNFKRTAETNAQQLENAEKLAKTGFEGIDYTGDPTIAAALQEPRSDMAAVETEGGFLPAKKPRAGNRARGKENHDIKIAS